MTSGRSDVEDTMRRSVNFGLYRSAAAVLAAAAFMCAACTRDYVTGRPTFSVVSEANEIRIGAEEDKSVVAAFGQYNDKSLTTFVSALGKEIVRVSHRPELPYTFRVLDSPVLNAFALPGGYVYVTRGLLAHVNSTDELVGILSHEVGHVAGRHSAEQISKQIVWSGFGLLTALSRVAPRLGGLLSAPSALVMLAHSRRQEKESDKLGVEYTTRLGYDATELARFLNLMNEIGEEDGKRMPTFLSTHPDPGDRAEKVVKLTKKQQAAMDWKPKAAETAAYLRRIDGIVVGENPRQGFVKEAVFYHPEMRFQFPVPERWTSVNSRSSVLLLSPAEDALVQLTVASTSSLEEAVTEHIETSGLVVRENRTVSVSGLDAVAVESVTPEKDLQVLSYFIQRNKTVFVFHGITDPLRFDKYRPDFIRTMKNFSSLRTPSVLEIEPDRLRIKTVSYDTVFRAFLSENGVSPNRFDAAEKLNGRALDSPVRMGEQLKVILK